MESWNPRMTKLGHYICIFIAICPMFSYHHVHGRSFSFHGTTGNIEAIKTIQSKVGDIIDCVDIYKQPAFNHPFLKNHTIQMKPSSYPRGMEAKTLEAQLLQDWQCPQGTVPIVRSPQYRLGQKTTPFSPSNQLDANDAKNHEFAQVSATEGNYFGASARFNLWKPATFNGEFSLAQIWLVAGDGQETNSLKAGWRTYPETNYTRLFISWSGPDGYQRTGCYNLECPGFVQISNKFGPDAVLAPLSRYAGDQFEISTYIYKDKKSGNWWLRVNEIDLGYWPSSIFKKLSDRADIVSWGGEIVNSGLQGRHTSTQMGSGHFPSEGYRKASYIRNIRYVDESGAIHDVQNVFSFVTKPECYGLQRGDIPNYGTHFFYGGPGYSDKCLV